MARHAGIYAPSRRALLGGAAAGLVTGMVPRRARAAVRPEDRRFLFVLNLGGWDPLLVFAPLFGYVHVEMEVGAAAATAGGISYVDHPDRPAVRTFFEAQHARTLVWNGLLVPSLAHPPCQRAMLTGFTHEAMLGDWPTLLGLAAADRFVLPSVVLSGPSFPGDHADIVCRSGSNGQLGMLLDGTLAPGLDVPVAAPSAATESAVDAWLAGRASRYAAATTVGRPAALAQGFSRSSSRVSALKARSGDVAWGSMVTWADQLDRSVEVFAAGLARTVTLFFTYGSWDSHVENDANQSDNYQTMFDGLSRLCSTLASTPGVNAPTLADEVVIVLLSEMGRTPLHNAAAGRDHWPYTTAMIIGDGVTGDRVVGDFDENYFGVPIDEATGDVDEAGIGADMRNLGATLLALGGVDPEEALPGVSVVQGVLT